MIFPKSYINEVVEEIRNIAHIWSNITCMEDINNWVSEFGDLNYTLIGTVVPVF